METKRKILVVDDDPEFVSDLNVTLRGKDYKVTFVNHEQGARESAEREQPDLILVGSIMPRGAAFQLHQWLRNNNRFKDIPIIVLDSPPGKQSIQGWRRDEGFRLLADDYFCKPLNTTAFMGALEKLLDKITRKIKVLVADDHEVVREGIRALLSLQKDMQVVGEAVDGEDAVEKTLLLWPDLVLMDILMPKMNGIEATRYICRRRQDVKILMLSQYDDEENVLASRQAGACGFISKRGASTHLLDAIRGVGS